MSTKNTYLYYRQAEEKLLRSLMSSWQRRGCTLLHIGLHSYLAPEFFWDAGFDVCATDENLDILRNALEKSGPRVEYQIAKFDSLPFDDDAFDYAFFTCYANPDYFEIDSYNLDEYESSSQNTNDINKKTDLAKNIKKNKLFWENVTLNTLFDDEGIFSEACRVAQRGIILLGRNRFALRSTLEAFQTIGQKKRTKQPFGKRLNVLSVLKKVRENYSEAEIKLRFSFRFSKFFSKIFLGNQKKYLSEDERIQNWEIRSYILPFGDLFGIVIDFNPSLVTGLGVLAKAKAQELAKESLVSRNHTRS